MFSHNNKLVSKEGMDHTVYIIMHYTFKRRVLNIPFQTHGRCVLFCCHNDLHSSGFLERDSGDLCSLSYKSIREVRQ